MDSDIWHPGVKQRIKREEFLKYLQLEIEKEEEVEGGLKRDSKEVQGNMHASKTRLHEVTLEIDKLAQVHPPSLFPLDVWSYQESEYIFIYCISLSCFSLSSIGYN